MKPGQVAVFAVIAVILIVVCQLSGHGWTVEPYQGR